MLGVPPGTFTDWEELPRQYRPAVLRGPARRGGDRRGQCRALRRSQDRRRAGDQSGVDAEAASRPAARAATRPRPSPRRSCAACTTMCITSVPQFSETDINFQRAPTVDTSNPFVARSIPTPDESIVVIRFRDPRGVDFPYLVTMIAGSWMSRANSIVIPGNKLDLAMQLILTPRILELVETQERRDVKETTMTTARRAGRGRVEIRSAPLRQRHSRAGDGRGREGEVRPSRHADGHGRRRDRAVPALHEVRRQPARTGRIATASCCRPATARCCSMRCSICSAIRAWRANELEQFRQLGSPHRRPSRIRPCRRHRDDHRPARPGPRHRGRHGDRRAPGGDPLRRRSRRSFHLCDRRRRLPDGRRQP